MSDAFSEQERKFAETLAAPVPDAVHARLNTVLRSAPVERKRVSNRRLMLAVATLAAAGLLAGLWFFRPPSDAERAYAAVVKALEGVDTMHLTGWRTDVEQRWQSSREEELNDGTPYTFETWEWVTDDGEPHSYSKQGPIIVVVDGDRRYEYDTRYDHLSIWATHPHEIQGPRLRGLVDEFERIDPSRVTLRDLGAKLYGDGNRLRGIAWEERNGGRGEVWFDRATNLPVRMIEYQTVDGVERQRILSEFEFDVPVPTDIVSYTIPETENVDYDLDIDPRFEPWRLHLRKLANRLNAEGLPDGMALLPRESDTRIEATYPGRLPGITQETGLWVRPIQETLKSYVVRNWSPRGSIDVAEAIAEFPLHHDLLTSNDFTDNERVRFVVDALGFELVETVQEQTVWVATYDGRKLKPWESVKAPVPNLDNVPLRPGMRSTWGNDWSLKALLDAFALGTQTAVIDETGIGDVAVASEAPYWNDSEASIAVARTWFLEEFGVSLTKEVREQPSYVVQRR